MLKQPVGLFAGTIALIVAALLLSSCSGYRNPCEKRATYEQRQACHNQLIDFDRGLRGNRSYRTL